MNWITQAAQAQSDLIDVNYELEKLRKIKRTISSDAEFLDWSITSVDDGFLIKFGQHEKLVNGFEETILELTPFLESLNNLRKRPVFDPYADENPTNSPK